MEHFFFQVQVRDERTQLFKEWKIHPLECENFYVCLLSPFFTLLAVKLNVFCLFSGRLMYKFRCCQVDFHFDCPDERALAVNTS